LKTRNIPGSGDVQFAITPATTTGGEEVEHVFDDYPGPGDDIGSFADNLNSAIDGIQAQDEALIAQYGHTADTSTDAPGPPAEVATDTGTLDPSDQTVVGLLDDASHGTLPDETNTWADNLNNQVNGMQAQTDAAITNAVHSPGFGEVNPHAGAILNAFGTAEGIDASAYQDAEDHLAQTDTDNTLQDGESALTDAETAAAAPDGSAEQ
jgi:hypothetical protein